MRLGKLLCALMAFLTIQVMALVQTEDQLLKDARKGDPKAMYELGLSSFANGDNTDAYSWILKSAKKDYAPAQAVLGSFLKNGIATTKDLSEAWLQCTKAYNEGDGLAAWVLAQICEEKGGDDLRYYLESAYERNYPLAKLLFAKYYAEGNADMGVKRDETLSDQILEDLYKSGNSEASALLGVRHISSPQIAFPYLKKAADERNPVASGLVASMLFHGEGIRKNPLEAFKYYEKAAQLKVPSGLEGLADCYRIGIGTGVFQERAFNLYKSLSDPSPRVNYILGCYYNEGVSTVKDPNTAASLFENAAAKGNVFAQALLGTAHYDGSAPFEAKDFDKAYSNLRSAIGNKDFDQLPADMAAKVYNYVARCVRFGRGGAVEDNDEADRLQEKADVLSERAGSEQVPFASVGIKSFAETVEASDLSWQSPLFENILDKVTYDYPKDYLDKASKKAFEKAATEVPKPVVEEKPTVEEKSVVVETPEPVAPVTPPVEKKATAPKSSSSKSGRLAVLIEAAPYCFAPTSVVSSRDNNTYWLKGSAIDVSASVGWLANSGLFIGGGAGFESFSGGRMSSIQGFIDARYFMGGATKSGLFLGARGGVAFGSPEYGIGITASGMLGYSIPIGGSTALILGLKAGINSFSDEAKTMGNVVGPFVGICF